MWIESGKKVLGVKPKIPMKPGVKNDEMQEMRNYKRCLIKQRRESNSRIQKQVYNKLLKRHREFMREIENTWYC